MSAGIAMTAASLAFSGYLRGTLNGECVGGLLSLTVEGSEASVTITPFRGNGEPAPAIHTFDPSVARFLRYVCADIEPPIVEPAVAPPRKVEPVTCPDCLGWESYDCETCKGSGFVPDYE